MKRIKIKGWLSLCFLVTVGFGSLPTAALADYRPYYGWGPGTMGWCGPIGWFGPWGMILFWVLMILVIVLLIRRIRTSKGSGREAGPPAESALEILKKRYARGEVNKEEYLEKKKDLE
jgi:putative membrane protein